MSVFRSAITGNDGTIDPGYLAIYITMASTMASVVGIATTGGWSAWKDTAHAAEILQATGIAIGAICTGCGAVIAAVGAFRMGDKPRGPQPAATTNNVSVEMGK